MSLTAAERETLIRRCDDESEWDLFTDNAALRRQLERKGYRETSEGPGFYKVPLHAVRISGPKRRQAKKLSEAEREAIKARFQNARLTSKLPQIHEESEDKTGGP